VIYRPAVIEALRTIWEAAGYPWSRRLKALLPLWLDNGSEFINQHLWDYCQAQEIQFTRGRPYQKDDNAHIEQKNWTHVRKLLGYVRYDSPAAQQAINALYRGELRLFQNRFLPSVQLIRKERIGARVRRRYDASRTPLERVLACPDLRPEVAAALRRQRDHLDPFVLAQAIDQQLERIYALANLRHRTPAATATPVPVPRPARKRPSIAHFGHRDHPDRSIVISEIGRS
jgi:hypothetical protein